MRTQRLRTGLTGLGMVLALSVLRVVAEDTMLRAGAARGTTTPALGAEMYAGFQPYPALHIHDDTHVRAVVLDDGTTRIALVVCDALDIMWHVSEKARELIEKEAGLSADNVMISATHAHSTEYYVNNRFASKPELDPAQARLVRVITDTVRCAISNLEPAEIGWGRTEESQHLFNRRWYLKPGTVPPTPFGTTNDLVKMNPGVLNPNLVRPAGPIDPEIGFFAVRTMAGKPLALFANYALHYVGGTGKATISADYYGAFDKRMAQLLGADWQEPQFVAMMSNGASGDINNIDVTKSAPKLPKYAKIRFVADDVANKVVQAYKGLKWYKYAKLGVIYQKLNLEYRKVSPSQLAWAKEELKKLAPGAIPNTWSTIYADRLICMTERSEPVDLPMQAFRIGSLGIGTFPTDTFCEVGMDLKKRSPFEQTIAVSHAHGFFGYMPTPEQHALGGYETWIGTSRYEVNASTKMVDKLLEMLNQLHKE